MGLEGVEFHEVNLLDSEKVEPLIQDATVVTIYLVKEALVQIRPLLEKCFLNTPHHSSRIVTCGYEMPGWDPSWTEVQLGLPIYLYNVGGTETGPLPLPLPTSSSTTTTSTTPATSVDRTQQDNDIMRRYNDKLTASALAKKDDELRPFISPSELAARQVQDVPLFDEDEKIDFAWDDFDESDEEFFDMKNLDENGNPTLKKVVDKYPKRR
mmetsp:Transcript_24451/g.44222  ORF Transcript_24451/g.44222 Transcript_24451/m.44222 type:complete len:211 (-) Transcript_24451:627-1259(-)